MKELSEMNLDELIEIIEEHMKARELSDEYLKEYGHETHDEYGIGEYGYGIVTIPCEFILEYLKELQQLRKRVNRGPSFIIIE